MRRSIRFVIFLAIGFPALPLLAQTSSECQECHGDPEFSTESTEGITRSLFVDGDIFANSMHGDFECIDCHADISELPHEESLEKVDCLICHEEAGQEVDESVHGRELGEKSPDSPACADCHGTHDILPRDDPASRISSQNQPATCARCHADPDLVKRNKIVLLDPVRLYQRSIHGERTLQLKEFAATCSDCHGGHAIRHALDEHSSIYKLNIPETCGKCHEKALQEYAISVHATSLEAGAKDSPVCTDCHSEHEILRHDAPRARTSGFNVAAEVCSPCHKSERLAKKYGLRAERVETYASSYHGLALRGGKQTVANCGSCHGVHDILPSTDPRSHINPANLSKTCGRCHPNATENFARGSVHLIGSTQEVRIVSIVRLIYIILISGTVGFMVIHNGIDFVAKMKKIRAKKYDAGR